VEPHSGSAGAQLDADHMEIGTWADGISSFPGLRRVDPATDPFS